jgi:large subunit ribosomal protein L4
VKLKVLTAAGKDGGQLEAADDVFGIEPNRAVVHQVYVAQMNARRSGVANTKTRSEVRGSTAKLRRQKGTGRARLGSARSPLLTGGGVAFGPKTRSYAQRIPKRLKRLAIRSVLSAKAGDGQLVVVDGYGEETSTKQLRSLLAGIGIERSSLIVTASPERAVVLSGRNLARTKVLPASYLNVADMLNHQSLVMSKEAVKATEQLWGGDRAVSRRAASAPPQAVEAPVETPKDEPPKKTRTRKAPAARAAPAKAEAKAPADPAKRRSRKKEALDA